MKTTQRDNALDNLLKKAAPPLGAPDAARVERACDRLVAERTTARSSLSPDLFVRSLTRIAACVAVALGIVLAYRIASRPAAGDASAANVAIPMPADLNTLLSTRVLTDTLATESANFVSDLTDLTVVLNNRACAILF